MFHTKDATYQRMSHLSKDQVNSIHARMHASSEDEPLAIAHIYECSVKKRKGTAADTAQ